MAAMGEGRMRLYRYGGTTVFSAYGRGGKPLCGRRSSSFLLCDVFVEGTRQKRGFCASYDPEREAQEIVAARFVRYLREQGVEAQQ